MRLLLLLAALAAASQAQSDCSRGACYPPSADLLQGRGHQLQASSTCGLTGSEVYCTPYQQLRMKCCPCDSRNPNSQLAHNIQNVLPAAGAERWWQSKKETSPVTIQLDLHNLFQLDNLVLNFKGPRPSALVIERSLDGGRSWSPSLYLATDCRRTFPGVPTVAPLAMDQTYCYTLPPMGANPYEDNMIQFSPLRQYAYAPLPNSQKIESVSGLTALRVRLTQLGDVPRLSSRPLSRFFALRELKLTGSCMCHGHANRCLDHAQDQLQVGPRCDCQHNTAGTNCERCDDLYNDLPWRPAEEGNTHSCQRCQCHNHARRCRFDAQRYEDSGRRSGGVCEGCMHHTAGPQCQYCAPGYQPNPHSSMDRPDACIRCVCDADGTLSGARCDDSSGACQCKAHVEGPRCDRCKRGFYGLDASNPLGCSKCSCSPDGSLSEECDALSGQCRCRPHFQGRTCESCAKGYWRPSGSALCRPCNCDPTASLSDTCDQLSGRCQCRPGFGGPTCTECPDGSYGDPLIGCRPCQCNRQGTRAEVCDKTSGACVCRPGVNGTLCDGCGRGRCDAFPACAACPSCFFSLDLQRQSLSLALDKLAPALPSRPGGSADPGNLGPRVRALEAALSQIRDSVSLPPPSAEQVRRALEQLDRLRDRVERANGDLSPLEEKPDLDSDLDKLQDLLDSLSLTYNSKKDALTNSVSNNHNGAISAIKNAYDESTDASKEMDASQETAEESAGVREQAEDLRNRVQPPNGRDLDRMNQSLALRPDLAPLAEQVCGVVRSEPCSPLRCPLPDLCPPEEIPVCKKGKRCVGALPLSKRAEADAGDVKGRLERLSQKINDAAEKLQDTQGKTNQLRQSTDKLSNGVQQTRDQLEDDLKETRDVVKELKDFLSDPSSKPSQIQEVSDWVLKAKLPLSLAALKRKLEELQNLADNLPDSTQVLSQAEPQLEEAQRLLQEAQDARDTALGVKADVDGLLDAFGSVEGSVSELEDRLEDSMDQMDEVNSNLSKAKEQLSPVEKALDDVSTLMKPVKPQLDQLKDLLQNARVLANKAQDTAEQAEDQNDATQQDLQRLQEQLDKLKTQIPESGSPGDTGPAGERLAKLRQDAGALANTTQEMLDAVEGKADSLRSLQGEILQKSSKLEGLDTHLKNLVAQLEKKAHDLSTCQG